MIKLEKDGKSMEVRTEVQASAFLNNGWEKADEINPKAKKIPDDVRKLLNPTDALYVIRSTDETEKIYKKTDIMRMKLEDLKTLATKLEIEVTEDITGTKLKEQIVTKLGL